LGRAAALVFAMVLTAQLGGCGNGDGSNGDQTEAAASAAPEEPSAQDQAEDQAPDQDQGQDQEQGQEPAPTEDAADGQGEGGWAVGDSYSGTCTVAWPTSPTVTATDIQMTMSCSGLRDTYLVALVVYPDPDLKVTASTGAMKVEGVVFGFAETQNLGGEYPIILASSVELP
jgi:hypothetical protein